MKHTAYRIFGLLLAATSLSTSAFASERASGQYTASKRCAAYASFAKASNPGNVHTTPGTGYPIIEVNKPGNYDWIRVEVPGAEPRQRWVRRDCGNAALDRAASVSRRRDRPERGLCNTFNQHDSYVLALSWQPGFCEHVRYKGRKPECNALNGGALQIDHLTLHGLWPNRKECGTSYGRCKAPDGSSRPFQLKDDTVARIAPWMPNFRYERAFGKHEWDKHGTCQPLDPDAYFDKAIQALRIVNDSDIGNMIRAHIGTRMPVEAFFERVRQRYGNGVARNIQLVCVGDSFLHEVRARLPREFTLERDIGKMIGGSGFRAATEGCESAVYVERSGPN